MVARPVSAFMGNMAPISISLANSSLSTLIASSASSSFTPIDVEFSEDACDTMKTDMPLSAKVVKMRWLTPITPTIDKPVTVMRAVPLMLEIPLIGLWSPVTLSVMMVPSASGLKVFFTFIGIFFTQTGYIVGGYITFAPKLQSSIASTNDSSLIGYADVITRGSAVMKPSTSVHISNNSASSAAAMMAAV